MAVFAYVGVQRGKRIKGTIDASNLSRARAQLREKRVKIKKIKQQKANTNNGLNMNIKWGFFGSVPKKEILMFTKKLSTMIRAGLPIIDSFIMIADQTKNKNMKQAINEMVIDISEGRSLSMAFKKQGRHFDNIYVNMIEAGEVSGQLDKFIDKLTDILEKQAKIRAGIKSAMFYPITILFVTMGVLMFMMTKVVPTFQEMYDDMGLTLPGPTQVIVMISDWVTTPANIGAVIGSVIGLLVFHKTMKKYVIPYHKAWCWLLLHIPLFGNIIVKAVVARSSLLMASLFTAGVSVLDTLEIAESVTTNVLFVNAFRRIRKSIMSGIELSILFGDEKIFPTALSQLLAVGERTGNMEEMLNAIAQYYEEEFNTIVEGLSTIIEPIMIVFIGAVVGAMVIALYLPILSAGDLAGG